MHPPPQPPTSATTNAPHNTTHPIPQFHYQSNVEDQKLTGQLLNWLLEGKLTQTTPAHILAASTPICKDLARWLCTCHIETTTFEQATPASSTMQLEPEYTLPLCEINILVRDCNTEAGVIVPVLQIIAIRKDLADEVSAHINPGIHLKMESTNSAKSWRLSAVQSTST